VARVIRGGQFGRSHPVSLSGEDSCFVDSQEGPSTTGPHSALMVVQWSKVPPAVSDTGANSDHQAQGI